MHCAGATETVSEGYSSWDLMSTSTPFLPLLPPFPPLPLFPPVSTRFCRRLVGFLNDRVGPPSPAPPLYLGAWYSSPQRVMTSSADMWGQDSCRSTSNGRGSLNCHEREREREREREKEREKERERERERERESVCVLRPYVTIGSRPQVGCRWAGSRCGHVFVGTCWRVWPDRHVQRR